MTTFSAVAEKSTEKGTHMIQYQLPHYSLCPSAVRVFTGCAAHTHSHTDTHTHTHTQTHTDTNSHTLAHTHTPLPSVNILLLLQYANEPRLSLTV